MRLLLLTLSLVACAEPEGEPVAQFPPDDFAPPEGFWSYSGPPRLLVPQVDTAWQAGIYGVLDPDSEEWVFEGGHAHSDAVARCAGPWLLLVNRLYGDNLQFVDPDSGATLAQWSTGNGSNPQDVVFHGEHAWVSLYEEAHLLVARWWDGREEARLDLSPWADQDGLPEASSMFSHGGLLWVTLERLDRDARWDPAGESLLLGVDPITVEVVEVVQLPLPNPVGGWTLLGDRAFSAAAGALLDAGGALVLDGGIMEVDLASGEPVARSPSEEEAGRDFRGLVTDGEVVWLSTYDQDLVNRLDSWELSEARRLGEIAEGFITGLRMGEDGVWLGDHAAGAVRRHSWPSGALEASVATPLRPSAMEVCRAPR